MSVERIIGIDLGTSNSCLSYCNGTRPEVIVNSLGARVTPSVVAYREDGQVVVGEAARRQAIMNPAHTISAVKRLVGRQFDSPEVRAIRAVSPYEVIKARNGDAWVKIGDREISPPEVQAHTLMMLKQSARAFFEAPVIDAVITVPAFFDETQRQATRDAAEIAGLRARRILSESTAAALAYGYGGLDDRKIVVVDLGGGTLDVTLMSVDQGKFITLATAGDMLLGGADFDRAVALRLAKEIEEAHGVDVLSSPVALQRLIGEAEDAKKVLTDRPSVDISLPFLAEGPKGPINFERKLSADEFELVVKPLIDRIARPCQVTLKEAGIAAKDVDDVLLIGGMTRSPVVQRKIAEIFQRKPQSRINPDEAVAMGASVLGAVIAGQMDGAAFVDVAPRTLGIKAAGDRYVPLIRKSTPLPARIGRNFKSRAGSSSIQIELLQGEDAKASNNRRLAFINLDNIPAGQGEAIKFELGVDEEGLMQARALLASSGTELSVRIEPSSGLGRAEVERMSMDFAAQYGSEVAPALPDEPKVGFSVDIAPASDSSSAAKPQPAPQASASTSASPGSSHRESKVERLRREKAAVKKRRDATPPPASAPSGRAPSAPAPAAPVAVSAAEKSSQSKAIGSSTSLQAGGPPKWLLYLALGLALALGAAVAISTFLK